MYQLASTYFVIYTHTHTHTQTMLYYRVNQVRAYSRKVFDNIKNVPVRKLFLAFLPFLCHLIVFNHYNAIRSVTNLEKLTPPNYYILLDIESSIFFFHPHRILSKLANPVFDFLAAIPYLFHFPLPFIFAIYLCITPRKRPAFYPYLWCAGWVTLITILIHTTFPTAPPWFVDSAVLDEHGVVIFELPNEAAFRRIDRLLGITFFHDIYAKSPVKFGAFPSLHVAWPMVVFLNHPWGGKIVGGIHVVWITLAALYTTHHFFLDAIGGMLLVVAVRLSMFRIWSPFPELEKVLTQQEVTLPLRMELEEKSYNSEVDNDATIHSDTIV